MFEGIFLLHSQMIWTNHKCGLEFHAVNTCFSSHPIYMGKLWVLCSHNSDNQICTLCYALTPSEDKGGAVEFGDFCSADAALKTKLNQGILCTDSGPTLPAFAEFFQCCEAKALLSALDQVSCTCTFRWPLQLQVVVTIASNTYTSPINH